ncbi:ABC transporter permease [Deinococcus hopiensis]|uniref:ABC-2 type transport system permease protein n=1 Tax=Deinococcus hopiensis KR-140 TaxID=695939 RepID=A0A1W1VQI9_9DEIO|nr:ABC transporter permease [Deinococcus hopiensis]SMB95184.1 ABC-2 type transport system permease protein [Deinococcus hopiensis KR-140]
MLTLVALEFRKLLGSRSARLALLVCLLTPVLWLVAPRLNQLLQNVALVSGWQLPAISLGVLVQFLLPLFLAITCAEMIGAEVSRGTLAPLLLRPVSRTRIIVSKLIVALMFPVLLVAALVGASLLAGVTHGLGGFQGGTGLGPGYFVGIGPLTAAGALGQVLNSSLLAMLMLMPVAALSLLFGVLYLNTAAAALATLATLNIMRLLVVFPEGLQRLLLTTHLDLYTRLGTPELQRSIPESLVLLLIYTVGFALMAVYAFERRDV